MLRERYFERVERRVVCLKREISGEGVRERERVSEGEKCIQNRDLRKSLGHG